MPNEVCSKCHEDFMNCKCEQFHPNVIVPTENEKELINFILRDLDGQPSIRLYDGEFYKVIPDKMTDILVNLIKKDKWKIVNTSPEQVQLELNF